MRLTTKGKIVFGLLALAGFIALLYGVDHLNYMGGGKWCLKSLIQCDFPNG